MSDTTTPPEPDRRIDADEVTDETRASEVLDAFARHDASEEPTPEEEAAADRSRKDYDPKTGEAYRDYLDHAVGQEGEGRI
jgi:hypothetical protein